MSKRRSLLWAVLGFLLLVSYQNCSHTRQGLGVHDGQPLKDDLMTPDLSLDSDSDGFSDGVEASILNTDGTIPDMIPGHQSGGPKGLVFMQVPPLISNEVSGVVLFRAKQPDQIQSYLCQVDDKTPVTCEAGSVFSYGPLDLGRHTLKITMKEKTGPDVVAEFAWDLTSYGGSRWSAWSEWNTQMACSAGHQTRARSRTCLGFDGNPDTDGSCLGDATEIRQEPCQVAKH